MHSSSSMPSHLLPPHIQMSTLQRACAPSSAHCPSPGRTGGPWTGSQAARGKRPCTPRRGVLSSRRSGSPSATSSTNFDLVERTCWLMSRMAMSLRSEVKRSKAASMALFSVLASTTRKFFCASGGWVTCCAGSVFASLRSAVGCGDSRRRPRAACPSLCPVRVSQGPLQWRGGGCAHLVANDGEELPVFVCGGRGCHVGFVRDSCGCGW